MPSGDPSLSNDDVKFYIPLPIIFIHSTHSYQAPPTCKYCARPWGYSRKGQTSSCPHGACILVGEGWKFWVEPHRQLGLVRLNKSHLKPTAFRHPLLKSVSIFNLILKHPQFGSPRELKIMSAQGLVSCWTYPGGSVSGRSLSFSRHRSSWGPLPVYFSLP